MTGKELTEFNSKKRTILIRVMTKCIDGLLRTLTHSMSKRRNILLDMKIKLSKLDREFKRDYKASKGEAS